MGLNDKILLLRYSDYHGIETVNVHAQVISEVGKCWWAKIGKQPSQKYLKEYLEQKERVCLLYTPGILHICKLGGVVFERPKDSYPAYYDEYIFGKENEPKTYFELLEIKPIDMSFLEDYVVSVSGKEALYDLKKTISSFIFIQHKDAPRKERKKRIPAEIKKKEINNKDCKYRVDGCCNNKSCVNYKYECLRPEYCVKQKIKK